MFHLCAFFSAIGNVANTQINALNDQILPIGPSQGFLIQQNMPVQWGFFGVATPLRARLITPTWRSIQIPQIRPISAILPMPSEPNICDWRRNPLISRGLEEMTMEGTSGVAGPSNAYGVVALDTDRQPAPGGPVYPVRCTCTGTTTASTWTDIAIAPETAMQEGTYAVVGADCVSATGIAFRLITDHTVWRPGGLCQNAITDRGPMVNYVGEMGLWCRFTSTSLPRLQVLANAAETPIQFTMFVIRISERIMS